MSRLLSILFLFFLSNAFGQITISGVIKDQEGHPVPGARCWFKNKSDFKVSSDRDGKFEINFEPGAYDSLLFYAVGFEQTGFYVGPRIEKKALKKNGYQRNIIMPDKVFNIVVIQPELPDTLHGDPTYSISDFAYDADDHLVLLTYEKTLRRGSSLRLVGDSSEIVDVYLLEEESVELKNDFRNNIHLITDAHIYLVRVEEEKLVLYLEDREHYLKNIAPIVDTLGDKVYYSSYSDLYPAFDYFEYDVTDSSHTKLIYIEDSFIMPFYRAEFKYLPQRTKLELHRKEKETGIDKEIWAGALYFTKSMYYDPIYAPLFRTAEDSIMVFDHYKNRMFKYSPRGGFTDSVRISYHQDARKSGWAQPLIQDEKTLQVYAVFERSGSTYLREINLEDGRIRRSFKLHHKYVEEMQIRNGEVQYIYRPFESPQKKFLYSERLKMRSS